MERPFARQAEVKVSPSGVAQLAVAAAAVAKGLRSAYLEEVRRRCCRSDSRDTVRSLAGQLVAGNYTAAKSTKKAKDRRLDLDN